MNKGIVLVLGTAVISGVSIFLNAFGVQGFDSSIFSFSKNFLVALFIMGILFLSNKFSELKQLNNKQWFSLVGIGLVGGSIPFLLFFKGLQLTSGSLGAFIHKTLFVWIGILAVLFLKERINKSFLIGAASILVGNYFFLQPSLSFEIPHLLILGATLFWAVEQVWAKKVIKEVSGTIIAGGRMFFGSAFILLYLFFTQKTVLLTGMTGPQYLWILVTSVFLLGYVLTYYNGIKHINISTAASILVLGSPITTLLQTIFLGSILTTNQVIGGIFLFFGVTSILFLNYLLDKVNYVVTSRN